LIVGLLLCLVVAMVLPTAALAGEVNRISCSLRFDSGNDASENRGGRYYFIPASGGDVTLLVGVYAENHLKVGNTDWVGQAAPVQFTSGEVVWLSPSAYVSIRFFDQADPSHILFQFQGTLAELTAMNGAQVVFDGRDGVLVRIPLHVDAGSTWWVGRMNVVQGGFLAHCDVNLIMGGVVFFLLR